MDDARIRSVLAGSYRASALVAVVAAAVAYFDVHTSEALILGILTSHLFVVMTAGMARRIGAVTPETKRAARRGPKVVYALKVLIAVPVIYLVWRALPDKLIVFAVGYTVPLATLFLAALWDMRGHRRQAGQKAPTATHDSIGAQDLSIKNP